jgi:hypothetical protein
MLSATDPGHRKTQGHLTASSLVSTAIVYLHRPQVSFLKIILKPSTIMNTPTAQYFLK